MLKKLHILLLTLLAAACFTASFLEKPCAIRDLTRAAASAGEAACFTCSGAPATTRTNSPFGASAR